jgi:hypothetical protein
VIISLNILGNMIINLKAKLTRIVLKPFVEEKRYCIFARLKKINNTEFSSNEKNLSTLEKKKKK